MTSPFRTRAPSCDSAQVTTPARSDLVVDSSTSRRAWLASLSSVPRSSVRVSSATLRRGLGVGSLRPQLVQLDAGLGQGQLGAAERVAREQPLGDQRPVAGQPGLGRLDLELLDGDLAVESASEVSSVRRCCGLLVLLHLEIALQLVERQHRLAGVELDDGVAALDARAGPLQDAQHAGVHRAGEHALDLGDDGARGHDHRLDRAGRHAGGADAGARHAGPQQVGQPRDEQHHADDRHGGDHDADAHPAASFGGSDLAIHAGRLVKARARSRRLRINDLRDVARRPGVQLRTNGRPKSDDPTGDAPTAPLELSTPSSARHLHRVAAVSREVSHSHHCSCGVTLAFFNAGGRTEHAATVASSAIATRRNDTLMSLAQGPIRNTSATGHRGTQPARKDPLGRRSLQSWRSGACESRGPSGGSQAPPSWRWRCRPRRVTGRRARTSRDAIDLQERHRRRGAQRHGPGSASAPARRTEPRQVQRVRGRRPPGHRLLRDQRGAARPGAPASTAA